MTQKESEPRGREFPDKIRIQWGLFRGREDLPFKIAAEILKKEYQEFAVSLQRAEDHNGKQCLVVTGTAYGKTAFLRICGDAKFIELFGNQVEKLSRDGLYKRIRQIVKGNETKFPLEKRSERE